jgi:multiple sugar transport system substrate-binding protein
MKKRMTRLVALVLLLSGLSGMVSAQAQTTISVAVSGSASELALRYEAADLYMEQNPDVKIEWIDLGGDRITKTMTLISGGAAPDVLYINENVVTYASKGVLEPLDKFIEAEEPGYLDGFYKSLIDLMTWRGSIYAMPQEVSPYVVYYNKTLLDQYGIEPPTDEWTFDEWYAKIVEVANAGKEDKVYGQNLLSWADHYLMHLSRMGIEIYDEGGETLWIAKPENREAALKGFQFLADAYLKDFVCPTPSEITAMGEGFSQAFRNQKIVFQTAGMWDIPTYLAEALPFEWDIVMSPYSQDGSRTTRAGILNWGIYSGSQNKDTAWDFIKFLIGHEGQMIIAKYNMALPSAYDEEANQVILDSKFPANVAAFGKSVEFVQQGDSFSLAEDEINNALTAELQNMVLGLQSPEEALDNFLAIAEEVLADAVAAVGD